jgi:hypothetical protein
VLASLISKYLLYDMLFHSFVVIPVVVVLVCVMTFIFGMNVPEKKVVLLFLKNKLRSHV